MGMNKKMTAAETRRLKKCPFYGNKDVTIGSSGNTLGVDIYVRCACGAKIQICEEHGEELIKRWNRRCCDI